MYAILASPHGAAFATAEATDTLDRARACADDAVYGMGHARALVLDLDTPARIVYDTERDGPWRNCPRCGGYGRYQIAVDEDTECEGCDGTGHTHEPERWITCSRCNGSRRIGDHPCYDCSATGVQEDWEAHF